MPSFTSLAIPALYQTSRSFAPRSLAAMRQAQYSAKAAKPEVVTFEEIDTLIHKKDKVQSLFLLDCLIFGQVRAIEGA